MEIDELIIQLINLKNQGVKQIVAYNPKRDELLLVNGVDVVTVKGNDVPVISIGG